jgi:hypothetical protein
MPILWDRVDLELVGPVFFRIDPGGHVDLVFAACWHPGRVRKMPMKPIISAPHAWNLRVNRTICETLTDKLELSLDGIRVVLSANGCHVQEIAAARCKPGAQSGLQ